jgi:hypothetical protein
MLTTGALPSRQYLPTEGCIIIIIMCGDMCPSCEYYYVK